MNLLLTVTVIWR